MTAALRESWEKLIQELGRASRGVDRCSVTGLLHRRAKCFFSNEAKVLKSGGRVEKAQNRRCLKSSKKSAHSVMTQGAKSSASVVGVLVRCFLSSPKSTLTSTRRFYNTLCFHLQKSTTCSQCQNCYHDHVITVND